MKQLPVACSLDAVDARAQLDAWKALAPHERSREDIPGGVRVVYAQEAAEELERVAEAERACCGFLDITLEAATEGMVLTVLAPEEILAEDVRRLGVS